MRSLHEKASIEIEEEDKRRKRRLAITEASNSQDALHQDGQGSIGSVQIGALGGENNVSPNKQKLLEGSMSADNMGRQSQFMKIDPQNAAPATSTPYGKKSYNR